MGEVPMGEVPMGEVPMVSGREFSDMLENEKAFIRDLVHTYGKKSESVLSILKAIQYKYYYLPESHLKYLCSITSISPQQAAGVASFYSLFRRIPAGRHTIRVCVGTACHVKGAVQVLSAFKTYLGIPEDQDTDEKRLFTVEEAACLGCCMLAPAVRIDETIYGHLAPDKVPSVISDFLSSRKPSHTTLRKPIHSGEYKYLGEIRLCTCSSCSAAGAQDVYALFAKELQQKKINVKLVKVGCTGLSFKAPLVEVRLPMNKVYHYGCVGKQQVRSIINHHFTDMNIMRKAGSKLYSVFETIYTDAVSQPITRYALDIRKGMTGLYREKQVYITTEHNGELDPLDYKGYEEHGGFVSARKSLTSIKNPHAIISIIRESRLRGRGGAGFPTYKKWENVLLETSTPKYLICNGDEGDPGAFMDRMLLESFPLRIIEGILIAGFTLGIEMGIIYIRTEYPLAIERIRRAISLCEEHGLIGENILETNVSFSLKVIEGAGAFVCGEETALIESILGRRGMPHARPPYPTQEGLYGQPTLMQNVETFAAIPWIIREGAAAFANLGTTSCGGTKTFALAGKIERGGLIEVPMGTTLKDIVEEIGGGIQQSRHESEAKKVCKAVLVGGPSGGCIPADHLDVAVDFDALQQKGAIMGSGGLVVLDNTDCMVEIARYFMAFTQSESCGKCTFCRIGTKYMLEILTRLTKGEGKMGDIEELTHISALVKKRSLCGLGKTAPTPVLSALTHFFSEFEAHIQGRCPAKKCKALITYSVTDECIGCTKCAQGCPVEAIISIPYEKHIIQTSVCIRCDACRQNCPQGVIIIE